MTTDCSVCRGKIQPEAKKKEITLRVSGYATISMDGDAHCTRN